MRISISRRVCCEASLVCVAFFTVWGLLSLPIIFYHLERNNAQDRHDGNINKMTCPGSSSPHFINLNSCLLKFMSTLPASRCSQNMDDEFYTPNNFNGNVEQLISALDISNASEDCKHVAIPFLCLYSFSLCNSSSDLIQPTMDECKQVRDSLCQREWNTLLSLNYTLPECDSFPPQRFLCNNTSSISNGDSQLQNEYQANLGSDSKCHEGFYKENESTICMPSCYTWLEISESKITAYNSVIIISSITVVESVLILFVLSCHRRKELLKFPSYFLFYLDINVFVQAILLIIIVAGQGSLYCSSMNLIESLEQITPFCVFTGILIPYLWLQSAIWTLFFEIVFLWSICFPFTYRCFDIAGKLKYLHIFLLILGLLLPFVHPIAVMLQFATEYSSSETLSFWSQGAGFWPVHFLCLGRSVSVSYYSFVLLLNLIAIASFSLLIIGTWMSVNQKWKSQGKVPEKRFMLGSLEIKLIAVYTYSVIATSFFMLSLSLTITNSERLREVQTEIFLCEKDGNASNQSCDLSEVEKLTRLDILVTSFILYGLIPMIHLFLFVIDWKILKQWYKQKFTSINSTNPEFESLSMS